MQTPSLLTLPTAKAPRLKLYSEGWAFGCLSSQSTWRVVAHADATKRHLARRLAVDRRVALAALAGRRREGGGCQLELQRAGRARHLPRARGRLQIPRRN